MLDCFGIFYVYIDALLHLGDPNLTLYVSGHINVVKFCKLTIYDNQDSETYLIMM